MLLVNNVLSTKVQFTRLGLLLSALTVTVHCERFIKLSPDSVESERENVNLIQLFSKKGCSCIMDFLDPPSEP